MLKSLFFAMLLVSFIIPASFMYFAFQVGANVSGFFGGIGIVVLFVTFELIGIIAVGAIAWIGDRGKGIPSDAPLGRTLSFEEIEAKVDEYIHRYPRKKVN